MSEGHTKQRLMQLQKLPLERKVGFTAARITQWYTHYKGKVYVSFSGGKDSTVLLHIARTLFPDIKAVFVDTGLEFPEVRQFVKTFDNVEWLKPTMNFKKVIETYGYPVISKEVAKMIWEKRAGQPYTCRKFEICDRIQRGEFSGRRPFFYGMLRKWRHFENAPFKISDKCCAVMKKSPVKKYEHTTGLKPMVATTAEQSLLRQNKWLAYGCNAFDNPRPLSTPMAFWTEQDILLYIKTHNLPIVSIYGDIVETQDGKLRTSLRQRTGCVFCMFGITHDDNPNRIQMLAQTHPKLWNYCIFKLGLKQVLEYMGVPWMPEDTLFNQQQEWRKYLKGGEDESKK